MSIDEIAQKIFSCRGEFNLTDFLSLCNSDIRKLGRNKELELIKELWSKISPDEKNKITEEVYKKYDVDDEINEIYYVMENSRKELVSVINELSSKETDSPEFESLLIIHNDLKANISLCQSRIEELNRFNLESKYFNI